MRPGFGRVIAIVHPKILNDMKRLGWCAKGFVASKKPKKGDMKALVDCNHCGECCLSITCQVAQVFFKIGEGTLCPALEQEDGLYFCGLIRNTKKYVKDLVGNEEWKPIYLSRMFGQWLGIGYGCDSENSYRPSRRIGIRVCAQAFWGLLPKMRKVFRLAKSAMLPLP